MLTARPPGWPNADIHRNRFAGQVGNPGVIHEMVYAGGGQVHCKIILDLNSCDRSILLEPYFYIAYPHIAGFTKKSVAPVIKQLDRPAGCLGKQSC